MFKIILIVGTGGFLGTISRFLVSKYFQQVWTSYLPYGTLVVNVTGCLLIGILYGLSARHTVHGGDWKLFFTVGFCGAFTTFSAFTIENIIMLKDQEYLRALLNISVSLILGFGATVLGFFISKSV